MKLDHAEAQIITNPPFTRDILHPMIEKFTKLAPTWLLLDAGWMFTKQAQPYLKYCSRIVTIGRLKWIEGTNQTSKDDFAWYKFDRGFDGLTHFYGRDND